MHMDEEMHERPGTSVRSELVQSLDRGLLLMELVSQANEPISLAELGRMLDVDRSTAHRLLGTLVKRGYVHQDPDTKRYRPGLKAVKLAQQALSDLRLPLQARPFVQALMRDTGESASLAMFLADQVICADSEPSGAALAVRYEIGMSFALHATASGKMLLSSLPRERQRKLIGVGPLTSYTPNTIRSTEDLLEQVAAVAEQGYAVEDEERYTGVLSIACLVYDHREQAVAALGLGGPKARLISDEMANMVSKVSQAARRLSAALGSTRGGCDVPRPEGPTDGEALVFPPQGPRLLAAF